MRIQNTNKSYKVCAVLLLCCSIGLTIPRTIGFSTQDLAPSNYDPIILVGDEAVDQFFAGNGTDGLSWETAFVIRDLHINANQSGSGIKLSHTNRYIRIENTSCAFSGDWYTEFNAGIRLDSCQNLNITKCTLWDCGFGLLALNCSNLILQNDTFIYCRNGCQIQSSSNLVVQGLTVYHTYLGIAFWSLSSCTFTDLIVEGFQYGIGLYYCHDNQFINLKFVNPSGIGATNVILYDSAGNDFGDYHGPFYISSFDWSRYIPTILIIGAISTIIFVGWGVAIRRRKEKARLTQPLPSQTQYKDDKKE